MHCPTPPLPEFLKRGPHAASNRRRVVGRGAFTLVELLVVIAIIGILISLLLPAVQAAREAARRMQCSNNLKQMGLALHNYHDSQRRFPPGGITEGPVGTKSRINWAIAILPYMEQKQLYDLYDHAVYNEDPGLNDGNNILRQTLVETYVCPSEPNGGSLEIPMTGPGGSTARGGLGLEYRSSSYKSVAGCIGDDAPLREQGWWDMYMASFPMPVTDRRGVLHTTGLFGWTSESFRTVVDGTSSTLMVGEKSTRTQRDLAAFWSNPYVFYAMGHAIEHPLALTDDIKRCMELAAEAGEWSAPCARGFGSCHPEVIPFLLVDGSVHSISVNIDLKLLCDLATIDGGEAVQVP